MRTTMFHGRQMKVGAYDQYERVAVVEVPTLSAYAVEYAEFTPPLNVDVEFSSLSLGNDFGINADELQFFAGFSLKFSGIESCRLLIHYHGIRDYSCLFPMVEEQQLKVRLGQFYEEAERTFENGSWLAFALMAAAVYEGLLGWKLKGRATSFAELIASAHERGLIENHEVEILGTAREHRNLVHAARFATPWVQRADAMDMRITMDGLVRKLAQ